MTRASKKFQEEQATLVDLMCGVLAFRSANQRNPIANEQTTDSDLQDRVERWVRDLDA